MEATPGLVDMMDYGQEKHPLANVSLIKVCYKRLKTLCHGSKSFPNHMETVGERGYTIEMQYSVSIHRVHIYYYLQFIIRSYYTLVLIIA